ncbi:laccase-1 precursor [Diaporthe helianthi]|uniref:Laccase-1 n=1 Tax=Diaporthe helianthi TaxID=158607 RepID=A0A2P5HJK1_DIAHE|nr:laccase-1 precursor [Diaporthe helianthi]
MRVGRSTETTENPWGNVTADLQDPDQIPSTGVTHKYHFTVSRANLAPDGVTRPMILINGKFPGPTIEANWGDMIEVTLENQVVDPAEGTTIHWHGLRQIGTPWYDGVPSTVQCPLPPGSSFTYKFQADSWGSTFYHSHYSAQYSAGVYGAMIIHGPKHPNANYDEDLGPIFLSDWFHTDYNEQIKFTVGLPAPITQPYSDNNMINGRMPFDCSNPNVTAYNLDCSPESEYSTFRVTSGKTYRLRLMNVGSQGMQRFTIDGMNVTVIAQDFIPVVPYDTDVVNIGIGQRTDVLFKATGEPTDALWMRSDVSPSCSTSTQGFAKAAIYYEDADTSKLPETTATPYDDSFCGNVFLNVTRPLYPMDPPPVPATTLQLDMRYAYNASGNRLWFVNNETFRADFEHPIFLLAKAGNTSYPNPDWLTFNLGSNSSVRIIMNNYSMTNLSQHPMHLHGHNFWVVAEGLGEWDGSVNLDNPMRRDTHILQPGVKGVGVGYLVIDFVLDNPGVWPLHCHLAWHVEAGLYVNLLERPDDIAQMDVPSSVYQTCKDWTGYHGADLVPEIDSGV